MSEESTPTVTGITESPNRPITPFHPKFPHSADTEVTFQSSDGVHFCLHRKNLETHAEAFPGAEIPISPDEVTNLTEPSEVLAIVFDFMYPRKQADIETMDFGLVIQVAEAVEKYQNFSAMKVCEMRLKQFIPTHAAEVMAHGMKHDYPALINDALPMLSRKPLVEVLEKLPTHYYLPWCRYHQAWNTVFRETIRHSIDNSSTDLSAVINQVMQWESLDNVTTLRNTLFEVTKGCNNCRASHRSPQFGSNRHIPSHIQQAATFCLKQIREIPQFSSF